MSPDEMMAVDPSEACLPGMVFGTYEEAVKLVGTSTPPLYADLPVDASLCRGFAGMVEDDNPAYWRATPFFGDPVAPPGMLLGLLLPLPWSPEGELTSLPCGVTLPLPGTTVINTRHEVEFFRPLRYGMVLRMTETIVAVSPSKRTALGLGNFIISRMELETTEGEPVGAIVNTLLRYTPDREGTES